MKLSSLLAKLDKTQGVADSTTDSLPDQEASARLAASVVSPEGFLAMIEMMREHERYGFADRTLCEIYDTVKSRGMVTEPQLRAVRNIRHSVRNWEDAEVDDV